MHIFGIPLPFKKKILCDIFQQSSQTGFEKASGSAIRQALH
jgi:hypothetical protein